MSQNFNLCVAAIPVLIMDAMYVVRDCLDSYLRRGAR